MEDLLRELIDAVEGGNTGLSGDSFIALLSLLASWITIAFLLKERSESNRPYLQISFELIKSNLACIVLRNTGNVPLTVRKINFSEEFIKQLPQGEQQGLKKTITNMTIFPGKYWVICLGVIVPDIIEKFEKKELYIEYQYSKLSKRRVYSEDINIDFEQYSHCLVYISEIDELREVNKEIEKEAKEIKKQLKGIHAVITKFSSLDNNYKKIVVNGYINEENSDQ